MPMYGFKCISCKHEFDQILKHAYDLEELECPECKSGKIERQYSGNGTCNVLVKWGKTGKERLV